MSNGNGKALLPPVLDPLVQLADDAVWRWFRRGKGRTAWTRAAPPAMSRREENQSAKAHMLEIGFTHGLRVGG